MAANWKCRKENIHLANTLGTKCCSKQDIKSPLKYTIWSFYVRLKDTIINKRSSCGFSK